MKNKKAFTIVEVLAVVVLLGVLAGIALPVIQKYIDDARIEYNKQVEKQLLVSGKSYFSDNKNLLPKLNYFEKLQIGEKQSHVTAPELVTVNYLKKQLVDYDGNTCDDSYVLVTRNSSSDNEMWYPCLICSDGEKKIVHSNYDYCSENVNWNDQEKPTCAIEVKAGTIGDVENKIFNTDNARFQFETLLDSPSSDDSKNYSSIVFYNQTTNKFIYKDVSNLTEDEIKGMDLHKMMEDEGVYSISILDKGFNKSDICIDNITIDNTDPDCTITGNPNGWVKEATLTVFGTDSSGVLHDTPYSWNGKNNWNSNNAYKVTKNDKYTAYVRDKAENIKECEEQVNYVDSTIPTVTISAKKKTAKTEVTSGSWSDEGLNFTLTKGTTGESGYTIYYCKDTSNVCDPQTKVESGKEITSYNTIEGTYYIRYKIVSGANVSSPIGSYQAKVDFGLYDKEITMKIVYDTSTYKGPSSTYKSDTYQKLSKSSTALTNGESETITASPAYPDDRYKGSVSCTNGVTATLTAGTGTTTRTDTIKITNNSTTTTASVCTITYTPKWQGITYGSYTAGDTVTYSGTSWTIKADNGSNTGLVLNTYAGNGSHKSNIKTELADKLSTDTAISDANNGGLVEQSNGYYVTTNGGISTGYTDVNYWTDSTHFYNAATRTFYKANTTKYLYGQWNGWGSGEVGYETVNTSVSSVATLSTGIKSTTSDYYTVSGGKVTFKNATYSSTATNGYYTLRMTRFRLGSGTYNGVSDSPNKDQLAYLNYRYTYSASDGYTLTHTALIGDTGKTVKYVCGGTNHGKVVVYEPKSSTVFYYGNQGTGTGWSGSSWDVDNAKSYLYTNSDGERFNGRYAGYASTCGGMAANIDSDCVEATQNGQLHRTRRYRFHNWDDHTYCKKRTKYILDNTEKTLYYRPYIIVRER